MQVESNFRLCNDEGEGDNDNYLDDFIEFDDLDYAIHLRPATLDAMAACLAMQCRQNHDSFAGGSSVKFTHVQ